MEKLVFDPFVEAGYNGAFAIYYREQKHTSCVVQFVPMHAEFQAKYYSPLRDGEFTTAARGLRKAPRVTTSSDQAVRK